MSDRGWADAPPHCRICGEQTHWYSATLCRRCKWLRDRFEFRGSPDKAEWERALTAAWDPEAKVFRCHITNVPLVYGHENWPHPRYLDREHLSPGDDSAYAVCASVINQMKGAMSQTEFEESILRLAEHFEHGREEEREAVILRERVKTNLTAGALREFVLVLAVRFRGGVFDASVFDLAEP